MRVRGMVQCLLVGGVAREKPSGPSKQPQAQRVISSGKTHADQPSEGKANINQNSFSHRQSNAKKVAKRLHGVLWLPDVVQSKRLVFGSNIDTSAFMSCASPLTSHAVRHRCVCSKKVFDDGRKAVTTSPGVHSFGVVWRIVWDPNFMSSKKLKRYAQHCSGRRILTTAV